MLGGVTTTRLNVRAGLPGSFSAGFDVVTVHDCICTPTASYEIITARSWSADAVTNAPSPVHLQRALLDLA